MKRSTERILTTHAGSLPRPGDLLEMIQAKATGRAYDHEAFATRVTRAVGEIVLKQAELGVDVIDDGEMGKPGFIPYVNERLSGFEPDPEGRGSPWRGSREVRAFPEFYEWFSRAMPSPAVRSLHMVCTGPIVYTGAKRVQTDIENLKASLAGSGAREAFIPAISPTSIEDWQRNAYYKTEEEYLAAVAEAMHEEYKAIVDAGFLVQIDDPHLATHYVSRPELSVDQVRRWAEVRVEALNHALRGLPRDRIRWHTCYGINIGPRVHDLELKHFVDVILKIRAGAYSFEAANPRHEHEWRVWEQVKLPGGAILIPGTLTQSIVSIFVVSAVVCPLVRLSGDPTQIMMPAEASKADIELMRAHLGLDRPWSVQYWRFLTQALQGDFGRSVRFRRPALDLVAERYGATLELGGLAVLIVIVVALPVGVYSAVRRGSALDYTARAFAALGQAVPPFWLGLVLVLIFGVMLHLLPTSGRGTPLHVLLPGITLGWFAVAGLMRLTRSSMLRA